MSSIESIGNINTKMWLINFNDIHHDYADLHIGFTNDTSNADFNLLKFVYKLIKDDNVLQQSSYPPEGIKYVSSDQSYLVTERLFLQPETEYELYLWAENDGKSFYTTVEFSTPRPVQPYDSWVWNGEKWEAPVPMPDDGEMYRWDEETTNWILIEE